MVVKSQLACEQAPAGRVEGRKRIEEWQVFVATHSDGLEIFSPRFCSKANSGRNFPLFCCLGWKPSDGIFRSKTASALEPFHLWAVGLSTPLLLYVVNSILKLNTSNLLKLAILSQKDDSHHILLRLLLLSKYLFLSSWFYAVLRSVLLIPYICYKNVNSDVGYSFVLPA